MERPGAQEVMLIIIVRIAIARKKIRFMRFGIKVEKKAAIQGGTLGSAVDRGINGRRAAFRILPNVQQETKFF
jgi:hypothetical protein